MVSDPVKYKIEFKDQDTKQDKWLWGVFFYNMAFPLNIITCCLYYINNDTHKTSLKFDQVFELLINHNKEFEVKKSISPNSKETIVDLNKDWR